VAALYITSTESAGKTTLGAGLGRNLMQHGIKVGFMIPIHIVENGSSDTCADATFYKDMFSLTEADESICPFRLSRGELSNALSKEPAKLTQDIKQACQKISSGKDVVIMEGLGNLSDRVPTAACYAVADATGAGVIVVLNYPTNSDVPHLVAMNKKVKLLGVVANLVPNSRMEKVKEQMGDSLGKAGIKLLGVLPEVRGLLGVTVGELARALGGDIITSSEKNDEIVENVMVGAMTVDSGLTYFSRKENKAVVIRGERLDMQLAALQTPTKCMIITNGAKPSPSIIVEAQEKQVPIIAVKQDTAAAIASIEKALAEADFRNPRKLEIFDKVLGNYFDFVTFYSLLGLKA
jgi:uncharacterized protein